MSNEQPSDTLNHVADPCISAAPQDGANASISDAPVSEAEQRATGIVAAALMGNRTANPRKSSLLDAVRAAQVTADQSASAPTEDQSASAPEQAAAK